MHRTAMPTTGLFQRFTLTQTRPTIKSDTLDYRALCRPRLSKQGPKRLNTQSNFSLGRDFRFRKKHQYKIEY